MDHEEPDEMTRALLSGSKPENLRKFVRCVCGAELPEHRVVRLRYSGLVNFREAACDDCLDNHKEHARIVCAGCKRLVGFYPPVKHPSGFQFAPRSFYHTQECPACSDSYHTSILELERWVQGRGLKTRVEEDFVQEAEQKGLRNRQEIDKVRASVKDAL